MYHKLKAAYTSSTSRKRDRSRVPAVVRGIGSIGFARAVDARPKQTLPPTPACSAPQQLPTQNIQAATSHPTRESVTTRTEKSSASYKSSTDPATKTRTSARTKSRILEHHAWKRLYAYLQLRCCEKTCPQGARGLIIYGPPGSGKTFALATISAQLGLRQHSVHLWEMQSGAAMEHAMVVASRSTQTRPFFVVADHAETWARCTARREQAGATDEETQRSEFFTLHAWSKRMCDRDAPIVLVVNTLAQSAIRKLLKMDTWISIRFDPFSVHVPNLQGLTDVERSLIYECGGDLRAVRLTRQDGGRIAPGSMARASMFRAANKIMTRDDLSVPDVDEINRENTDVGITVWQNASLEGLQQMHLVAQERHIWSAYENQQECALHMTRTLYKPLMQTNRARSQKMSYSEAFVLRRQKHEGLSMKHNHTGTEPNIQEILQILQGVSLGSRSYQLFP